MKDTMEYRGYFGSVHYNDDDKVFYGKLGIASAPWSAMREQTLFHCGRLSRKPLTITLNSAERRVNNPRNL